MIGISGARRIFLAAEPIDFRNYVERVIMWSSSLDLLVLRLLSTG